jgi:hypothetical protein
MTAPHRRVVPRISESGPATLVRKGSRHLIPGTRFNIAARFNNPAAYLPAFE